MRRPLFFLWALLLAGGVGCAGKSETTDSKTPSTGSQTAASQIPPKEVTSTPGSDLTADTPLMTPLEGLFVKPYFDMGGATELSVAPGEEFDILLMAETVEPYTTNAVEFRMDIPAGMRVLSLLELETRSISMGSYVENYQIAYECHPVGKFRLVTFHCMADPDFHGGVVTTAPGLAGGDQPYLGFSTCNFEHAPANGGTATIKLKK